jgi:4-hydroxyisophthalate hydroxylase
VTSEDGPRQVTVSTRTQIAIIGGGPVGLGLAVELGLRGIACVLLERRTGRSSLPKGQALTQRTMEHMYRWGLAEEIRTARAIPPDYPTGMAVAYETLMSEFWAAPPARELVQDYYFQPHDRLPQYATEEVLHTRMGALPTVTSLFGAKATAIAQADDGVRVTFELDGTEHVLEADYVVGCDGARSPVREQADIERHGTNWDELVVLVVFRSKELHEALERYPEMSTYRVMHPDLHGYWMFFGRVDVGEQFFFHAPVPKGTDPDDFDPTALLHRAAGFAFGFEVDHLGFWDQRVQVAAQ